MRTLIALILMAATAMAVELLFPQQANQHGPTLANPLLALLIPAIISLVGTGAGIAVSSSQQKKARRETKKYEADLEKRRSDYESWFKSEYNTPFLDTEMGRSSINQIGAALKNTLQNQNTSAIRGGATPESQIAAQGQAQSVYADAVNRLAGMGTNYKQNLRNSYDYRIQNYLTPLDNLSATRIQNYANVGTQFNQGIQGFTTSLSDIDWNQILGGQQP